MHERDVRDEVITENKNLVKMLSYDLITYENNEVGINLEYYEKVSKLATFSAVFDMSDSPVLISISDKAKSIMTQKEINSILTYGTKEIYELSIDGDPYIAYNQIIKLDKEKINTLLITTFLPRTQLRSLTMSTISIILITVAAIGILLIFVTNYFERRITGPIKILVSATEKISKKDFDEKVDLKTGDELEVLADAINDMAGSLKRQDIEQKKFYEEISHDIKTPLTVISGYAQGIKSGILKDSGKALDTIIEECDKLKKELENVIYLSKLDTTNDLYILLETGLNSLVGTALEKLYSIIAVNEIDIIFEPKADIPVRADSEKFNMALLNILSNCIKYTRDAIYIDISAGKDTVKIEISDNGSGFSRELLDNPFGRATVGEKDGSGIGLSIIKKIIDGHNGKIALSNKAEGGAIYTIEIPVHTGNEA